eukprot:jgi/Galph1/2572/GphlegSOOS_G1251.1
MSNFEVRNIPGKGRGLVAQRAYKVGDVIFSEEASAFATLNENYDKVCHACLKMSESLKTCGHCQFARYCGTSCQKTAWTQYSHSWECKAIQHLHRKLLPVTVRLAAFLLYQMWSEPNSLKSLRISEGFHHSIAVNESYLTDEFSLLGRGLRMFMAASQHPQTSLEKTTEKELCQFIRFLKMNAHTVVDSELTPLGIGFFPTCSFINHNCQPNAIAMFINGNNLECSKVSIRIICIHSIQPQDEIVASYLDLIMPWIERRNWLLKHYLFDCQCSRCKKEQITCVNSSCRVEHLCVRIHQLSKQSEEEEKVGRIDSSIVYMMKAWDICEKELHSYSPYSDTFLSKQVQLASRLGYLFIQQEQFLEAIKWLEFCTKEMKKKECLSPVLALEFFKLGKLYAYIGKLSLAKEYLMNACKIYACLLDPQDCLRQQCEAYLLQITMEEAYQNTT